ncbi:MULTISPECIES: ribosome assembly RNA-binding protein YhbY [Pseudoxanthomonas]|jgi:RNA-binding protein|uniref:Ribosome assembly RNA-binding protein YhbY n=1 Tax=Pseudoxanthomonas mexicana TaxID=128785 RepID=A0ABX6RCZ3_PSEMX|nr:MULTISPECIES: ribosome assembly RNA-binding protein YhbY [Pseudoxanthomonas]MCA0297934.1 ribosome assembly RNA-binding protein YhbY [Pseudomonadota bacterium]KAF1727596.1 ribosome assembly RNA-binding protein YhbY [Pseudoxanthomonas mexicana]MBP6458413.1 ribosome assembly RNA-binding protein YhbY [Pseudoxanthomonas sp.]MBP7598793.1 ribosome assembly RNA-binding protein YhbY [Pseudoxanthomonas sp.]MCH2090984.1 ribosome assembly RNA-binding protein YhbY [Pseudoxanthomonas sp.]
MPVALTAAQTRFLRGQAHDLKALLQIGNKGVTPAFLAELDAVLEQHELVKVKVAGEDREARDAMIGELAEKADAALVQRIGHTAVLYRPSKERRQIVLPRG